MNQAIQAEETEEIPIDLNADQNLSDLRGKEHTEHLLLAGKGSTERSVAEKLQFLRARNLLRYIPPTGDHGGIQTQVARTVGKSGQYISQVLWPKNEDKLFTSDNPVYWQIWDELVKIIEKHPSRKKWKKWKKSIDLVIEGESVKVKAPTAPVYKILCNRLKHLGVAFTVEKLEGWPHSYIFRPVTSGSSSTEIEEINMIND